MQMKPKILKMLNIFKKNIIVVIISLGIILAVLSVIWRSALDILSVIASIYGGVGTLLAIKISTEQTNEIQAVQHKEIEEERERHDRELRKEFCDKIASDIAIYITDISRYLYESRHQCNLEHQIQVKKDDLRQRCVNTHTSTYLTGKQEIEDLENQKDKIVIDRTIAIQYYSLLMIKLGHIDVAQNLLIQLEKVHNGGIHNNVNETDAQLNKLQLLTTQFIQDYIK